MTTEQEPTRQTVKALMIRDGIAIEAVKVGKSTHPEFQHGQIEWACTLMFPDFPDATFPTGWRRMRVAFHQAELTMKASQDRNRPSLQRGDSHYAIQLWERRAQHPAPTALDVLSCVLLDATGYDYARDFADWCADLGFSDDSIKAHNIYQAVAEQAKQLRTLLGDKYREYAEADNDY